MTIVDTYNSKITLLSLYFSLLVWICILNSLEQLEILILLIKNVCKRFWAFCSRRVIISSNGDINRSIFATASEHFRAVRSKDILLISKDDTSNTYLCCLKLLFFWCSSLIMCGLHYVKFNDQLCLCCVQTSEYCCHQILLYFFFSYIGNCLSVLLASNIAIIVIGSLLYISQCSDKTCHWIIMTIVGKFINAIITNVIKIYNSYECI